MFCLSRLRFIPDQSLASGALLPAPAHMVFCLAYPDYLLASGTLGAKAEVSVAEQTGLAFFGPSPEAVVEVEPRLIPCVSSSVLENTRQSDGAVECRPASGAQGAWSVTCKKGSDRLTGSRPLPRPGSSTKRACAGFIGHDWFHASVQETSQCTGGRSRSTLGLHMPVARVARPPGANVRRITLCLLVVCACFGPPMRHTALFPGLSGSWASDRGSVLVRLGWHSARFCS